MAHVDSDEALPMSVALPLTTPWSPAHICGVFLGSWDVGFPCLLSAWMDGTGTTVVWQCVFYVTEWSCLGKGGWGMIYGSQQGEGQCRWNVVLLKPHRSVTAAALQLGNLPPPLLSIYHRIPCGRKQPWPWALTRNHAGDFRVEDIPREDGDYGREGTDHLSWWLSTSPWQNLHVESTNIPYL